MNLMELFIKLTADTSGLDSGLSAAEGEVHKSGGRMAKVGAVVGKAMLAATTAVATGVGAMMKGAIDNYAQYEQLVGGVETLFKDSAGKVQEYANQAYMTAGMSANEYMETVTSFSASLLQSLDGDTAKAADKADLAIRDMSDNANKMGSSMESIQNAYQGFAKQNYTMLDNLKLGYGGTKEEMQRLLDDAEKLSGQKFDISSYGDIVDAIHVVQTEMGITGTTAEEAATTIEGSMNSLKASWQNLLTGFGNSEADLASLVDQVVQNATQVATNVAPIALNAFTSIGVAAQKVAPMIIEQIPTVMNTITSMMLDIVSGITNNLPQMMEAGIEIILNLAEGLTDTIPELVPRMVQAVVTMATTLVNNGPKIMSAAVKLIAALAQGIIKSIPTVIAAIPGIISGMFRTLIAGVGQMASAGGQLIAGLWQGISDKAAWVVSKIKGLGTSIINAAKSVFGIHSPSKVFREIGDFIVQGFGEGIEPIGELTNNGTIKMDTAPMQVGGDDSGDMAKMMYEAMSRALDNHAFEINGREFGRLVKNHV